MSKPRDRTFDLPRPGTLVPWLLAVVPFAVLVLAVHRYYLPFPWGESYVMFPPLFRKWYEGGLSPADFYIVQNAYVVLFPAIIHFVLAVLSHWSQGWEVAFIVVLGLGLFGVYAATVKRAADTAGLSFPHALAPVVALLTFSLNQSCNWMWGGQIMTFLSLLCATAAIVTLSHPRVGAWRLAAAILLGLVATLSFGTGLLVWPAGFAVLALNAKTDRRRRWKHLLAWCAAGAVVVALFFASVRRGDSVGALASPDRLWLAVRFVPMFLSAGLVKFHLPWIPLAGYALVLAGLLALGVPLWTRRVPLAALVPAAGLMLYSAGLGFVAAFNSGAEAPKLDSFAYGTLMEGAILRYPTMALPYHVGLAVLLWLGYRACSGRTWRCRLVRWVSLGVIAAMALGSALSARTGYYEAQERYALYAPQARMLVVNDMDHLPTRLQWPYGNRAEEAVRLMKRHELSLFRDGARRFWRHTDARSNWD